MLLYDEISHRPPRTDRETAAGKAERYHTDREINLYAAYHAAHDESTTPRSLQIRPEQPTSSLQLPRPLAKDHKNTLANSRTI